MPVTMPAPGRLVVVHLPRGQRRQLEKRRARIEQPIDALAHRQLALLAMPLQVARAAALAGLREPLAQLRDERGHPAAWLARELQDVLASNVREAIAASTSPLSTLSSLGRQSDIAAAVRLRTSVAFRHRAAL